VRLDKPVVFLDGADCAAIAPTLAGALRRAELAGHRVDERARRIVHEVAALAAEWVDDRFGTSEVPRSSSSSERDIVAPMTTADVAAVLGCSTRNTRALARRGSLSGQPSKAGWLFDPVDVAAFVAAREETR
jgi:hypothetical protein